MPAEHAHACGLPPGCISLPRQHLSLFPLQVSRQFQFLISRHGLRKMKASITYELSAFLRKKDGYGCQDPANIWLAWKEWALIFQFSPISVCPVAFIKNFKSRDKVEWHSGFSAFICIPGSSTQDLNKEKAQSIEVMNSLQEQDHR